MDTSPTSEKSLFDRVHCNKKETHDSFKQEHEIDQLLIPAIYKEGKEYIVDLIQSASKLTGKLVVSKTSLKRPVCFPKSEIPYPFSSDSQHSFIQGTGYITAIDIKDDVRHGKNKYAIVTVKTACHVLHNTEELPYTSLILFYDKDGDCGVCFKPDSILKTNIEKDYCNFQCTILDETVIKTISDSIDAYKKNCQIVKTLYGLVREEDLLAIVISHPHGLPKHISVGPCKMVFHESKRKFTYDTATCSGSSGANVIILGRLEFTALVVHSASSGVGNNFSSIVNSSDDSE